MSDVNGSDGAPPPPEPGQFDAPPPPPPAVPAEGTTRLGADGGYGGAGKRLLARIIDGLVVGIPMSLILWVIPGITVGGFLGNALSVAAGFAYYLVLETSKGATLGKQALGMKVTDENGASPISMDQSVRRNWWVLLGLFQGIAVLGALAGLAELIIVIAIASTISSDARNQGWHDKLAGTLVRDRDPAG